MKHSIALLKEKRNIKVDEKGIKTFVNMYSYLFYRKNIGLYKEFDSIGLDGFMLVLFMRALGMRAERQSFDMTSLAGDVLRFSEERALGIYLIGSTEEEIESAVAEIKKRYPRVVIRGYRNGYFSDQDKWFKAISDIKSSSVDIVVVGLGAFKQDKFLLDLKESGWCGYGYTCGGFFHQIAGKGLDYYPGLINKMNARWLYRIYDEPKLIKRYFLYYPLSVLLFIKDLIAMKFQ